MLIIDNNTLYLITGICDLDGGRYVQFLRDDGVYSYSWTLYLDIVNLTDTSINTNAYKNVEVIE